jgi:hypothetical protein
MTDAVRDINGLEFAADFDMEMNNDAGTHAIQSPKSSIVGFLNLKRLKEFVTQNDQYKLVKSSGNKFIVDNSEGIRYTIKSIMSGKIKNEQIKTIANEIASENEEEPSFAEITAMPIKECVEIVSAIAMGDMTLAKQLIESLLVDALNERIEIAECEQAGLDVTEYLEEKFRIKVNAKGKRRRKLICRKGYKVGNGGRSCIRINAKEKVHRKRGMRKALRTKKGHGAGGLRRALIKRSRALRKRHSMGL